jgi:acetyl-CoA carboxylase biotin carboxylase subunit
MSTRTARAFRKILIANRGEIAVRILRACRDLGVPAAVVYSDEDRAALHVRLADEAWHIGPARAAESYLSIERILDAARSAGADAIHPGYGFLAENAEFAAACADAKIKFIGPAPRSMRLLGHKTAARELARKTALPLVPGSAGVCPSVDVAREAAAHIGMPVMLKAAAGGGGKGMRLVERPEEFDSAYALAQTEAVNAFGDAGLYVEKAIARPHHVEIQIFADEHGHVVYLGERECSVQRRHQKIVEETPSPAISAAVRQRMGEAAIAVARAASYMNAGTVEFLVDEAGNFYFLEVNTRLQVEHPITEMVTGLDLVKLQISVAAGEPLPFEQSQLGTRGHAIECRIYAEDPEQGFFPSPGTIRRLIAPSGPGIREDSGVYEGWTVPLEYDPMLSKLIAWGEDRPQAIARMRRALREYHLDGIRHNIAFFRRIFDDEEFITGNIDTGYVERLLSRADAAPSDESVRALSIACAFAEQQRLGLESASGAEPSETARPSRWQRAARLAALRPDTPFSRSD